MDHLCSLSELCAQLNYIKRRIIFQLLLLLAEMATKSKVGVFEILENELPKHIFAGGESSVLVVPIIIANIDVKQIIFYVNYLLLHRYCNVSITT